MRIEDTPISVFEEIGSSGRCCIVIGGSDSGKTTFVTSLANFLYRKGYRVAVVDSDVGQSDIGPPGTIGMGILSREVGSMSEIEPSSIYFVGSFSPERNLMPCIIGTKLLVEKAISLEADKVLIDTTGLVLGGIGRTLKYHKIMLVRPDHIVAIRRRQELDPILDLFRNAGWTRIHEIQADPGVRRRSLQARREYRLKKLLSYFHNPLEVSLPFSRVKLLGGALGFGKALDRSEIDGLQDELEVKILYGERISNSLVLIIESPSYKVEFMKMRRISDIDQIITYTPSDYKFVLVGCLNKDCELISVGIMKDIIFSTMEIRLILPAPPSDEIAIVQMGKERIEEIAKGLGVRLDEDRRVSEAYRGDIFREG